MKRARLFNRPGAGHPTAGWEPRRPWPSVHSQPQSLALSFSRLHTHPLWNEYVACGEEIRAMRLSSYVYQRPPPSDASDVEAAFDCVHQSSPSGAPGGLAGLVREAGNMYRHMDAAHSVIHPYAELNEAMPRDLAVAMDFVVSRGSDMNEWRERRADRLKAMCNRLAPLSAAVMALAPEHIRNLCGGMPVAMMAALIDGTSWPDTDLVRNFVFGFRSVGDVPDSGVFAPGGKPFEAMPDEVLSGNAAYTSQVIGQTARQFRQKPGEAAELWAKTMEEVDKGLCLGPFTRNHIDKKMWGYGRWRPMPRFGLWQNGKLRAIDDALSSMHNAITRTRENLRCCRADFPLRVARSLAIRFGRGRRFAMHVGTDDIASAYRLIPTAQPWYTNFAVADPEGNVHFFVLPGHNFGLTSAVLNFNRVPRFAVFLARTLLAVLGNHFYDDCVVAEPDFCAASGQRMMGLIMQLLGLPFSSEKHKPVDDLGVFLGVVSDFTELSSKGIMTLRIKPERRTALLDLIERHVAAGSLHPPEAASLEGKLGFCILSQFGRVGRAALAVLRVRARERGAKEITPIISKALHFFHDLLRDFPAFSTPAYPIQTKPVLVWTDAMFEKGGKRLDGPERGCTAAIGAIVWCPRDRVYYHSSLTVSRSTLEALFAIKDQYIGQLEMMAVMSVYASLPRVFRNALVLHFVDNQGVLWNTVDASSKEPGCAAMAHTTALLQAKLGARTWYEFVASAANVADLPSRGDFSYVHRLTAPMGVGVYTHARCVWFDSFIPSFGW